MIRQFTTRETHKLVTITSIVSLISSPLFYIKRHLPEWVSFWACYKINGEQYRPTVSLINLFFA